MLTLAIVSLILAIVAVILGFLLVPPVWKRIERGARRREARRAKTFFDQTYIELMSPVEQRAKDSLYYYPGGWASAVRLWGADRNYIPPHRLVVTYTHELLNPPDELLVDRNDIIQRLAAEAEKNGRPFFNGPNARLTDWRASPKDGPSVGFEDDYLYLQLGPVGWYDFAYLNEAFRTDRREAGLDRMYEYYLSMTLLLRDGSVRHSKLSNILDNAVTLITKDGFAAYQRRSGRVASVPGRLTSAVAENINRFWDETDRVDPLCLLHPDQIERPDKSVDDSYQPRGCPHPLSAVRRGLSWEISPKLAGLIDPRAIKLTGLSFDLEALHPDVLFAVFFNASRETVENLRRQHPGLEYREGELLFMPAALDSEETIGILNDPLWIPAGKASLIRAIELVEAVQRIERTSFSNAFRLLHGVE